MSSDHYSINFKDRLKAILPNVCVVINIISSKEIKPYIWISATSLQDKNQSGKNRPASRSFSQIQVHIATEALS